MIFSGYLTQQHSYVAVRLLLHSPAYLSARPHKRYLAASLLSMYHRAAALLAYRARLSLLLFQDNKNHGYCEASYPGRAHSLPSAYKSDTPDSPSKDPLASRVPTSSCDPLSFLHHNVSRTAQPRIVAPRPIFFSPACRSRPLSRYYCSSAAHHSL